MQRILIGSAVILAVFATSTGAQEAKSTHVAVTPLDLKWAEAPPFLAKGAMLAVLAGDPGKPGLFVVRLKMPAGYKISPHWHPTDEHVTVLAGTFALGMGDTFNPATMKTMPAGGYGLLPAEMHHYAMAKTAGVIQVHGMGPLAFNYVNPADDPSKAAPAK